MNGEVKYLFKHLIYSSRPFGFDQSILNGIMVASVNNNKRDQITRLLKGNPFYCDSSDGGINDILAGRKIKGSTKDYFQFIAEISGIDLFDINFNYKILKSSF